MNGPSVARRTAPILPVAILLGMAAPAAAATAVVTQAGAEAHSAPFAVSPVVGRLDVNTTVSADDQPANGWRRVRLPNGTFGFVVDEALRVDPPPAASPPAASPPAASPPPPPVAAGQPVAARVNVFELGARAQPDAAAPVLRVFPDGTLLIVAPTSENGWRRTQLADGQTAYVAEAGLDFGPAPRAARPPAPAAAPVQPLGFPPVARPRAQIYIVDLDQLAAVVAKDDVVSGMVDSLQTRRQAALFTMIGGGLGGIVLTGLGAFAFTHQDCPAGLDSTYCTKTPNWGLMIGGIALAGVAEVVGLALWPRRSDLFEVVNTWNPRHLDDQLTIESVPARPMGGQLF